MKGYLALIKEQREENDKLQQENEKLKILLLQEQNITNCKERIDKAINRISLIRMDRDTSIETHKALDEVLKILLGSDN